jgi:hypothetical protein
MLVTMHQRFGRVVLVSFVLLATGRGGDAAKPTPRPPAKRGLVFVVGGIGGIDAVGLAAHLALPLSGVPHEIRDFTWTHGKGQYLKDLRDFPHLMEKADDLAAEILRVKKADPERPIYLVGKSGGTGLVLAAVEKLPPTTIERIVLLSAAVSPTYDLRPALRATRSEIVSFYSVHDQLILGWGTRRFGTIDRFFGPSAGLVGFRLPESMSPEDQALYHRLVQVPWKPGMIWEGHLGTHAGTSMPAFVGKEVSPWLKP